jgi:energy-coupling factor transport system ATP-binding protein
VRALPFFQRSHSVRLFLHQISTKNVRGEPPLLTFNNISFAYPRQPEGSATDELLPEGIGLDSGLSGGNTLHKVSFGLERGEWVVLLGANGSGKSTLARLANGLLLPLEGEVVVDGISSWEHDRLRELRELVGLVTQDPDNQIVSTTVFDELAFGPQNLGWEPARIYAAVSDALAQVGLAEADFAQRDPNSLSGGEKQRVVIAATLAMQPNYLVLDEPTSMLDPVARAQVLEATARAVRQGHGVLQSTHILREAGFADRVVVLDRGRLVYDGAPEGILSDEAAKLRYGLTAEPRVRGPLPVFAGYRAEADNPGARTDDDGSEIESSGSQADTQSSPIKSDGSQADNQDSQTKSSSSQTDKALSLCEVSFSYPDDPGHTSVLKDFSLRLARRECLLLVGAGGSGKSTVLSLAAGLLQPREGRVLLGSEPPVPGQVGVVFQQPETQLFAQTLFEDIVFGPKNLGMPLAQNGVELVDEVLAAVGLEPARFKRRSPFSLSGGEARRAAIATTLALKTDFLLLDEPTAGLDAQGKVFIYELLQVLLAEGKGVLIASHDPDFFASLATGRVEL